MSGQQQGGYDTTKLSHEQLVKIADVRGMAICQLAQLDNDFMEKIMSSEIEAGDLERLTDSKRAVLQQLGIAEELICNNADGRKPN